MFHRALFMGSLFMVALAATPASADVPPPNDCNTPGGGCSTAPPDYQSPGTCTSTTCSKAGPDGGFDVPCNLCLPNEGGVAEGGTGAPANDDSGCTVAPGPASTSLAALWLLLGAGALLVSRRREPG